jgi:DnaJ like chaperone protein
MKWTGKIIGFLIGLLFASPILALIGLGIGHLYDRGAFARWFAGPIMPRQPAHTQHVFFNTSFALMGFVAKSDGRVSENEIRAATQVMQEMGLNSQLRQEAMRLFNEGKQPDFDWRAAVSQLRHACFGRPSLLRVFFELQLKLAFADGFMLSPEKQRALSAIGQQLGLMPVDFFQFQQHFSSGPGSRSSANPNRGHSMTALAKSYGVLGIKQEANDSDVKKAYRRLMSQHHPDKLIAKGLPPEMIKLANQKTQEIKEAYEAICAARGI